ncbi:flagellar motor protein MotB [Thermodesulfobacteriota bacterium B35]
MDQHRNSTSPTCSSHPVFVVDDTFFRPRTPTTPHWSIAWSDLMMTMFVLFLTLFVYQLAHRDFLSREKVEVVGGRPLTMPLPPSAALPFYPIYPEVAKNGSRLLRPVEDVRQDASSVDSSGFPPHRNTGAVAAEPAEPEQPAKTAPRIPEELEPRPLSDLVRPAAANAGPADADGTGTGPALSEPRADDGGELITEIFDLSRTTLASEKLEKFASVELIPDKTMRIILTGDLLFDTGHAELTDTARRSLRKLIPIIRQTPYMINVVGHTDSVPMSSPRYPTNWELSTARACQVARFLMEEAGIPGSQLIVTGYSYFRPVRPNSSEADRRANRRVEIILSREPAPAGTLSAEYSGQAGGQDTAAWTDLFSMQARH